MEVNENMQQKSWELNMTSKSGHSPSTEAKSSACVLMQQGVLELKLKYTPKS